MSTPAPSTSPPTPPTPITSPAIDQQVSYFQNPTGKPLQAIIVNIWDDGPVDVVITDPAVAEPFEVHRIVYVPYGSQFTPLNPDDDRFVAQLASGGAPTAIPVSTAPTEDGPPPVAGTEPMTE